MKIKRYNVFVTGFFISSIVGGLTLVALEQLIPGTILLLGVALSMMLTDHFDGAWLNTKVGANGLAVAFLTGLVFPILGLVFGPYIITKNILKFFRELDA